MINKVIGVCLDDLTRIGYNDEFTKCDFQCGWYKYLEESEFKQHIPIYYQSRTLYYDHGCKRSEQDP